MDVGDSSDAKMDAPAPPTAQPTISPADAAAQQAQVEQQEKAAQAAKDAQEAASVNSAERVAEKDTESATKVQQGAAATLVLSEAPKPYPEAPEATIQVSEAVSNARKQPMPAPRAYSTVAAGTYGMGGGADAAAEEVLNQQHQRDARIAKNGGKVSHVLPAEDPKYVNNDNSVIMTTDGPEEKYSAPTHGAANDYCAAYANRRDNDKPKWTKSYCEPQKGSFEQIMKNVDGVVCACGGTKAANVPSGPSHPGLQESVLARAQVATGRIRSYAHRFSSNVDAKAPRPSYGLTWEVRVTDEAATVNDHQVDPRQMQTMYITLNRITEFMDNNKMGLSQATVKQKDLTSGGLWGGINCDAGKNTWKNQKDTNCVLQDFFLDKFKLADLKVSGEDYKFTFASDIQGTKPWCGKDMDQCANPPENKPNITFAVSSSAGLFTDSKMSVSIDDFPYKKANSSLALSVSIFASSVDGHIPESDRVSTEAPNDDTDCNASPLPAVCPRVKMANAVQMSWSKTIVDTQTAKKYKVTSSPVQRYKSGVSSSNGMRLIHKKMLFSFPHGNAKRLLWDPKVTVDADPLPQNLKSAAPGWTQPVFTSILALAVACLALQNR